MDQIKLKRGTSEVTLKKVPDSFALRLKQGRANNEQSLYACCGKTRSKVQHIDSATAAKMDLFSVEDDAELDATMQQLRDATMSDVVSHVYRIEDSADGNVVPTGEMTIQFSAQANKQQREEILARYGLEVLEDLDYLDHGYTVRLTSASTMNPLKIAAALQEMAEIVTAEPDLSFRVALKHVPSDALYRQQWHLNNDGGQLGLKAGADVRAEQAWQFTRGRRDITVCVIDDGFDLTHSDFAAAGKIVHPRDFSQDDESPNPESGDDNHGTACAGVAIAEENDSGVVGLAPKCAFMPVRMPGWLSDQVIVDMFKYVIDKGADVASCSWSAGTWDFPLSTKMNGIIHKAATVGRSNGKGCVIVFAAGNEDRPLIGQKNGKVSHQGFAVHPDVITVAASNSLDQRSSYSNYGAEITLCAPSSGSPGRGIVTTDRSGGKGYSQSDYTYSFGGTSSATPLVAGLAGLILSLNRDLTSAQVRDVMIASADRIDEANGNYQDGHSEWYGAGRINAGNALALVAGELETTQLPQTLYMEHRVNRAIPDLGQMADSISFPLHVEIKQFEISVDIAHTWRGDLVVSLVPPEGNETLLFDRMGGAADNISATLRSSDEPGLFDSLLGKSAAGEWSLKISDTAQQDTGQLIKWGIAITY